MIDYISFKVEVRLSSNRAAAVRELSLFAQTTEEDILTQVIKSLIPGDNEEEKAKNLSIALDEVLDSLAKEQRWMESQS